MMSIASGAMALPIEAVPADVVTVAQMPLAVAEVSQIDGVPLSDLMSVVATMNRALVPPSEFIEVVRYTPVALADSEQPFPTYVTSQVDRGVTGERLAVAMADRIQTYGVRDIDVVHAPRVYIVDQSYVPQTVITRIQPVTYDPVALVAMPLAIAAVAELTDVPANELASFASLLNQARMPPAQFVEVVRYSPVALVEPSPQFLTYVTTQVSDGVGGVRLARSIADRYALLGADTINVTAPPVVQVVEQPRVLPPIVTTHVTEARAHPHGGPPGQLKKELGLQTGAEVVHGVQPGHAARESHARVVESRRPQAKAAKRASYHENRGPKPQRVKVKHEAAPRFVPAPSVAAQPMQHGNGNGHGGGGFAPPPQRGNGGGHGNGNGGGHGNGGGGKGGGKGGKG